MAEGLSESEAARNDPYHVPPPAEGYGQSVPPQPYPAGMNGPADYTHTPYAPPPAVMPSDNGLSDTAAGALAYITIVPAIIFLLLPPYNTRPFVKFHAFQCIGLAVAAFVLGIIAIIPILGWIVWLLGSLALLVVWILSLVKASQGSYFKLPVISEFAAKQAGYPLAL